MPIVVSGPLLEEFRRFVSLHGMEYPDTLDLPRPTVTQLIEELKRSLENDPIAASLTEAPSEVDLLGAWKSVQPSPAGSGPFLTILKEVHEKAQAIGLPDPGDVLLGLIPDPTFNACAVSVPGGHLILLNTGFCDLAYSLLKIQNLSMAVKYQEEPDQPLPPILSEEEAQENICQVVRDYFSNVDTKRATRIPAQAGARGHIIEMMVSAVYRFVIGHEYAHAVLNRAQEGKFIDQRDSGEFSREELVEGICDKLAISFLAPQSLTTIDTSAKYMEIQALMTGPASFFGIERLLSFSEMVYSEITEKNIQRFLAKPGTHPKTNLRAGQVINHFRGQGLGRFEDLFTQQYNYFTEKLVPVLLKYFNDMRKR